MDTKEKDAEYLEGSSSDGIETQTHTMGFDPKSTKKLLRKIDVHLIPFLALLYLLSFLECRCSWVHFNRVHMLTILADVDLMHFDLFRQLTNYVVVLTLAMRVWLDLNGI